MPAIRTIGLSALTALLTTAVAFAADITGNADGIADGARGRVIRRPG